MKRDASQKLGRTPPITEEIRGCLKRYLASPPDRTPEGLNTNRTSAHRHLDKTWKVQRARRAIRPCPRISRLPNRRGHHS